MRLNADDLEGHLQRGLAPVYVLSGDEPLLVQEAADAVRSAAREAGYAERTVLFAEPGFDWGELTEQTASLSLFAERRLVELRLPSGRPGDAGSRALSGYAGDPPADTLLLVVCGHLDRDARNSKWFRALEQAGVAVQVWSVPATALPQWIASRFRRHGLEASVEALELLAARTEGNLLAAAQEIDKLALLADGDRVDVSLVAEVVGDSARFDVFGLSDAALAGEHARAQRTLEGLRGEGVDPVLVLWALTRDVRLLAQLAHRLEEGESPASAFRALDIWRRRQPLFRQALDRHGLRACHHLVFRAARADLLVKGAMTEAITGHAWREMVELTALVSGAGAAEGRRAG